MNRKLLSIIVPINSIKYLDHFFSQHYLSFMDINSQKLELIFIVNGDFSEELIFYLNSLLDREHLHSVIKIIHSKARNLIDVFNDTLTNLNGIFATFIGSDDLYITEIIKLAEFAEKNNYDAIKFPLSLVYFWENTKNETSSLVIISRNLKNKRIKPSEEINKLISDCGQGYLDLELVGLYHGLIKSTLLAKVKDHIGRFAGGFSPDIYFATTLSLYTENAITVSLPFTISGIGKNSNSYKSLNNTHQSNIQTSNISNHIDFNRWPSNVPYFYSVETVWASSMIIALEDLNFNLEMDRKKLFLLVYFNNKMYRDSIKISEIISFLSITSLIFVLKRLIKRILNRIKSGFYNRDYIFDINIQDVESLFKSYKNNSYKTMFQNLDVKFEIKQEYKC